MSHIAPTEDRSLTMRELIARKQNSQKFSVVTCYDASFARLVEKSTVDMVLVGDSLGNVMLGLSNTLGVTMDDMLHHTRAVSRVLRRPVLVADMPFGSYQGSVEQAFHNAARLVAEAGAHAVKVEGGAEVAEQIQKITTAGIPVVAHIGLTPQSIHQLGGYRVQGRTAKLSDKLLSDALAVEQAGASAVVLELVQADCAEMITKKLQIPTIGIGAGVGCDAQVLVLQDLLGFDASFQPKFLKKYANVGGIVLEALADFDREVKQGEFPKLEHSYLEQRS